MNLLPDTLDALADRAAAYHGTVSDILAITPHSLTTDDAILSFWDERHLSHILPQSHYPDLADNWSNIIPEDPAANLARGDDVMTPDELHQALADNDALAHHLNGDHYWFSDLLPDWLV